MAAGKDKKTQGKMIDRSEEALESAIVRGDDLSAEVEKGFSRVLVKFPTWMIQHFDREAERLGIDRQAVIKNMIDAQIKAQACTKKEAG